MSVNGAYVKLNVERYGGMILSTWFDRPLSVAGRMIVHKNGKILEKLVDIDRDLVMIPSLAQLHVQVQASIIFRLRSMQRRVLLYSTRLELTQTA